MALFEVRDVDRRFYDEKLHDFLPEKLFDIHAHVYAPRKKAVRDSRTVSWPKLVAGWNTPDDLLETARLMFPDQSYRALMFGSPTDGADLTDANAYCKAASEKTGFPALLLAHPKMTPDALRDAVIEGGFHGIKVYLTFAPPQIQPADIRIFDFLTRKHLEVMDALHGIVMLHIARPLRLRDPYNVADLLEIERDFPHVRLIVAHIGRAYCRCDVGDALEVLSETKNMRFDFSANTNAWVMEQALRAVGPERLLFGSDLPITRMRMRRIERDGHYVNLVPRGMYGDVSNDPNMDELDGAEAEALSFFLYEELYAFRQAAEALGLSREDVRRVLYANANGMFT